MSHRYADDTTTSGVARMTSEQIGELSRRGLDRGLEVATHAIGDEAVRRTLDAYEVLLGERPTIHPGQLRIEHFSYAKEEDFSRAARLGVVLSIQSNFNALPGDNPSFGGMRVGASNEPRVYNWARLLSMGAILAEGSDYFTTPGAALAGFMATLERKYAAGATLPDSLGRRLSYRMNAVRFEPGGARVGGVIAVGAPADLVAWTADPFSVSRAELQGVSVKMVVNAGRVVAGTRGLGGTARYPIPTADGVLVDREQDVILVRWKEAVYAFARSCPHQNTALTWLEKDGRFQCPKHKSRYQPDGTFISGRATRAMDRFPLSVEGAEVVVNLDVLYHQDKNPKEWGEAVADVKKK